MRTVLNFVDALHETLFGPARRARPAKKEARPQGRAPLRRNNANQPLCPYLDIVRIHVVQ